MNSQVQSSWGGARKGAGRKSKDTELQELALMDAAINPEGWQRLFLALFEKACSGNVSAAKLIIERRFGLKPKEETSSPTSVKPPTWFMPSSQD